MTQTTPAMHVVVFLSTLHISALMVDCVQWGKAEHFREVVATKANIWPQASLCGP
jgi:hypothetical protein